MTGYAVCVNRGELMLGCCWLFGPTIAVAAVLREEMTCRNQLENFDTIFSDSHKPFQ